jgi:hypothetical protein
VNVGGRKVNPGYFVSNVDRNVGKKKEAAEFGGLPIIFL